MAVHLGDRVRVRCRFRDAALALTDPTTVFFRIRSPSGTTQVFQYGVDAEVTRESQGVYVYVRAAIEESMRWQVEFRGTGVVEARVPGSIDVLRSPFQPGA